MKDLFYMGGPLFMSILSILLIVVVVWIIYHTIIHFSSTAPDKNITLRKLGYGKSIGLFALITGILGQLIGLFMAFSTIEKVGDISPAIMMGGIKVSMITTLYGISIYLVSLLLWFVTSIIIDRK